MVSPSIPFPRGTFSLESAPKLVSYDKLLSRNELFCQAADKVLSNIELVFIASSNFPRNRLETVLSTTEQHAFALLNTRNKKQENKIAK